MFAIREPRMAAATLRPQDVVVLLGLLVRHGSRPPIARLGEELALSASEVHASLKRLEHARIIGADAGGAWLRLQAVEEFLVHAVKYAFPAQRGEVTRGVPTASSALTVDGHADESALPLVWPHPRGQVMGTALQPLYRTVPTAALRDPALHELLAIVDVIRNADDGLAATAAADLRARLRRLATAHRAAAPAPPTTAS
jgi:hypothetical protein